MVYECEVCKTALPARVLNCPKCGEGFDKPVPQDAEVPAHGWQQAPQTIVSPRHTLTPLPANDPTSEVNTNQNSHNSIDQQANITFERTFKFKRFIKICWLAFLVLLCIGSLSSGLHGNISGFWMLLVFGGPTIWLMRQWTLRNKIIITSAWAVTTLGFGLYSLTPIGKAAYAADQHDTVIRQQQEANQQKIEDAKAAATLAEQARHQKLIEAKQARQERADAAKQARQEKLQAAQDAREQSAQQEDNEKVATNTQQDAEDVSADNSNAINLSRDQVTQYLSDDMPMQESTEVRGQPRSLGQTDDKLALLEVIGSKDNVSQASLIIGLPNDSQDIVSRNTVFLIRFMHNIAPGWDGVDDWTASALKEALASPGASVYTERGDKRIEMVLEKPLGLVMVTVKHR